MSALAALYKQLTSSSRPKITVDFESEEDFQRAYSQLRTLKSKEEESWQKLFNESYFGTQVIRYDRSSEKLLRITFSLEPRLDRSKTKFTIVSSVPSQ